MLKKILFLYLFYCPIAAFSQFSEQKVITNQGGYLVHSADMNGDGEEDIIFVNNHSLVWKKNDGTGRFLEITPIITEFIGAIAITDADLDKDGDIDIISTLHVPNKIAWHENDGFGNFSEPQIISGEAWSLEIHSADLDGDGDMDILEHNKGTWYENDGFGHFSERKVNSTRLAATNIVDLDSDKDQDILIISKPYSDVYFIAWQENDGLGNFSQEQRIAQVESGNWKVFGEDLDGDGDKDILAYKAGQGYKLVWYEHLGEGIFSEQKAIASASDFVEKIYPTDIDGDEDIDIFAMSFFNHSVTWYENDGMGNFSKPHLIGKEYADLHDLHSADLDGDGDSDVLIHAWLSRTIAWYENFINYPSLQGTTFWDVNNNGKADSLEPALPKINVQIQPSAVASYTDAGGDFRFYVSDGTYTLSTNSSDCWQLSTDSITYTTTIDRQVEKNLDFGYQLVSDYAHTQVYLHSGRTRCGSLVSYWLSVENDGCLPSKGQYGLVLSPLVDRLHPSITPDEIRGDTLLWNYETLISGGLKEVQFFLTIAGTDFIGEYIELRGLSYLEDEFGQQQLASTYDYRAEIRCSYDPNDKLVLPDRSQQYEENYTLFEEALTYTIRFQNTGNDTAFNVVLKDQLDEQLDWNSFKPITASHPYETLLLKEGLLSFSFKNILLPDSTTNEPLSHGFVTYQILPKKGLPEQTAIENTAAIFFDINPPIITNTTSNVFVSALPTTTAIAPIAAPALVQVYPNPFQQYISVEIANLTRFEQLQLVLLDSQGKVLKRQALTKSPMQLPTQDLAGGIYLYQVLGSEGLIASGKLVKSL